MNAKHYTKEQVLLAIKGGAGVQSAVASTLGCCHKTAHKWIHRWAETREAMDIQHQKIVAIAVRSLLRGAQDGERWAVERILDTIGKEAGFANPVHAVDVTSAGLPIRVVWEDPTAQAVHDRAAHHTEP